ncbi:MAG: NusG domain II-containing protein [Eubacteriales bacterium]|nr:NusG domain II-containing protein [Eubacteriales bacterium]
MIKTKYWLLILGLLLAACFGSMLAFHRTQGQGTRANIYQNGVCLYSIDLSQAGETKTLTVQCEEGTNVIQYRQGQIRVLEADCPDQVCVRAGWSSSSSAPIICLPHHLVIRIEEAEGQEDEADALSQ